MEKELLIETQDDQINIALLEDKKLVEYHIDHNQSRFNVGDVYLGKVRKLMPGLNAVFIDVGHEKDAFLHYTDLSPSFHTLLKFTNDCISHIDGDDFGISKAKILPEIDKGGNVVQVIQGKPEILVQILKEPINSKGPRLSCEISLPGRFVVLTPFFNGIAISKKIRNVQERKRLQKIMESMKIQNLGVIVRTVAENQSIEELENDFKKMVEKWNQIQKNLKKSVAPKPIFLEEGKTNSILRDLLNDTFTKVVVNDKALEAEAINYISGFSNDQKNIIKYHSGDNSIFDQYGVTKQLKALFGKNVFTKSGLSLVIEHTEACHVIDVNSGTRKTESNQEATALKTNLEATGEIARQLRLRDLGGIVLIDFIDMREKVNREAVLRAMEEAMSTDRARFTILPISKFGLMQITRQRLKPEIKIEVNDACPSCQGTGQVRPGVLIYDQIEYQISLLKDKGIKDFYLVCNPVIEAYCKYGKPFQNSQWKWFFRFKKWIKIRADQNYMLLDFKFMNYKTNEEIIF